MQVNTSTCTQTKTRCHKLTHNTHGDTNASIGVDILASIKKKGTLNSPNCHTQSTTQRGSPNVKIYLEKFMHIHKLHTTFCASITVCLSRLFIYLLAYLFICVFIIRWTDFLFYLQALFRRENIHLVMRAVINSEQAHPSFYSSVRLSLSLCPSDGLSLSVSAHQSDFLPPSLPLCQSVFPSLYFPDSLILGQCLSPSLFLFFQFPRNAFSLFCTL